MAQERKKRRIVLASILKPVDDARMFEKMGTSLAQSGSYEVFIVGYPSAHASSFPSVTFIPLRGFHRLTLHRLWAKWRVFQIARKIDPEILIFNTHELLLPAVLLKWMRRVRILYDVRENYYRNTLFAGTFPWYLGWPLALLVRAKEKLMAPAIDHFFLAEKGYELEFTFFWRGWTVVENKAVAISPAKTRVRPPGEIRLLFSGTLAESTGVFDAIRLAEKLHRLDPSIHLVMAGHAALQSAYAKIQDAILGRPFITLKGGLQLVPHPEILDEINQADFGIISYPRSIHTENSLPTKLFEYLQARLPVILDNRWPWTRRFEYCQPFVFFDFSKEDYVALLKELRTGQFYTRVPEGVTWESEAEKFLNVVDNV